MEMTVNFTYCKLDLKQSKVSNSERLKFVINWSRKAACLHRAERLAKKLELGPLGWSIALQKWDSLKLAIFWLPIWLTPIGSPSWNWQVPSWPTEVVVLVTQPLLPESLAFLLSWVVGMLLWSWWTKPWWRWVALREIPVLSMTVC